MAWAFGGGVGSSSTKTTGTTLTTTFTAAVAAGSILIVRVAANNIGTVDAETTNISVSDTKSNTYTRLVEFENGQGAAAAGACAAIFASDVTTALTTADTFTVTWSTSLDARCAAAAYFTVAAGKTYSEVQQRTVAQDNTTAPSLTFSGLPNTEHLFITSLAVEGPSGDVYTADADYTELGSPGTSGGAAAANMTLRGGRRIATETGNTFNPTLGTSRDVAIVGVALDEVDEPTGGAHQDPMGMMGIFGLG